MGWGGGYTGAQGARIPFITPRYAPSNSSPVAVDNDILKIVSFMRKACPRRSQLLARRSQLFLKQSLQDQNALDSDSHQPAC